MNCFRYNKKKMQDFEKQNNFILYIYKYDVFLTDDFRP